MDISRIPPCTDDGRVNVVEEIPRGSMNKYEYDKLFDVFKDLQERQVHSREWQGADAARQTLDGAIAAYGDER